MSITAAGELAEKRKGVVTLNARTYTRAFLFKSDDRADDANSVLGHVDCPGFGSAHPSDSAATVRTITASNQHAFGGWVVECTYSTEMDANESNPDADEVLVSFNSVSRTAPIFRDVAGNFLQNTVGDPLLDPPISREFSSLRAVVEYRTRAVPDWLLSYVNSINDAPINIQGLAIAQGAARMDAINVGRREKRGDIDVFPVTLSFALDPNGWKTVVLNAGFNGRIETSTGLVVAAIPVEDDKSELTHPWPLTADGKPLTRDEVKNLDKVHWLEFDVYPSRNFSTLPGIN